MIVAVLGLLISSRAIICPPDRPTVALEMVTEDGFWGVKIRNVGEKKARMKGLGLFLDGERKASWRDLLESIGVQAEARVSWYDLLAPGDHEWLLQVRGDEMEFRDQPVRFEWCYCSGRRCWTNSGGNSGAPSAETKGACSDELGRLKE
jgi:hypothetical protein